MGQKQPALHYLFFALASFWVIVSLMTMPAMAQQSTSPSGQLDDEALTQNIKDRIKKIATQSSALSQKRKIAFIGLIQKIANETITIKTDDKINLASVSASTSYVRMPSTTASKLEDISIGGFAVAMGYINGSEVLETKRVLLYESLPEKPKKAVFAGPIKLIDAEENQITIEVDGEDKVVELTKNTNMNRQSGLEKTPIELTDLQLGQFTAVIYVPTTDQYTTPKALSILATTILIETTPDSSPPIASQSTQKNPLTTPPELQ